MADTATAKGTNRTTSPKAPDPRGRQLTAEDWIKEAQTLLVDSSIDSVRLDVLAKRLNVTRGSFYWHFANRQELLDRLLKYWRDRETEGVIRQFEDAALSPREIIRSLLQRPTPGRATEQASSVELAIRGWARRDAAARRVVDEVDAQRLSYIAQCFSALGFGLADARNRAFAVYGVEISEALLQNQGTAAQRAERMALMFELLLGSPAGCDSPRS